MKRIRAFTGFYLTIVVSSLFLGCSAKKVRLLATPKASFYSRIADDSYINGYPKQPQRWVVFSDRANNALHLGSEDEPGNKEVPFLHPLLVLKQKAGMFQVGEYTQEALNKDKINKKTLNVLGWMPQEKLLLWNNGLRNQTTGFVPKATLVINDANVIMNSEKYIENNAVFVYDSPTLVGLPIKKLSLGQVVYIYKQSADKERYLIGGRPSMAIDSIKNQMHGWVSKNVLCIWGSRSAIRIHHNNKGITKIETDSSIIGQKPFVLPSLPKDPMGMESIYPVSLSNTLSGTIETRFFTNVFNYKANKVYNVLGQPVYYNKFREILSNNKKLNIVFVLDVSQNNKNYIPIVKSLLQEMQLNFESSTYFNQVKFGAVVYKENSCNVNTLTSPLSPNYRDVSSFIEQKNREMSCAETSVVQPAHTALLKATTLLSGAKDETNIIVLIGTTVNQDSETEGLIKALSKVRARLILFQTQSKSADAYTDFVLMAQDVLSKTSQNIAELKKEKLVNQNDLQVNNDFNILGGENGVYHLDYPNQSMTQGYVIFPKKGEVMLSNYLKSSLDTLTQQVTLDNQKIDLALNSYFRSAIGIDNTTLLKEYQPLFSKADSLVPARIASQLIDENTAFLIKGHLPDTWLESQRRVEKGLYLNEQEFDQLHNYYMKIHSDIFSRKKFSRKKAIEAYMKIVMQRDPVLDEKYKKKIYKQTMAYTLAHNIGFVSTDSLMVNYTLKKWKRKKIVNHAMAFGYFQQFKTLADKMMTNKPNPAIRIAHKGQYFYWLNEDYMPKILPQQTIARLP